MNSVYNWLWNKLTFNRLHQPGKCFLRKISINLHDIIVLFGAHSIYIKVLTRVKGQTTSDWDTAEPCIPPTFPHTFNHHLLQTRKIPWTFLNQLITNCNFDMICECLFLLFRNKIWCWSEESLNSTYFAESRADIRQPWKYLCFCYYIQYIHYII